MFRHIRTLPLPAFTIFKLQDNGFLYCEDLWSFPGSKKNLSELFKMESSSFINTATCLTRSALDIWQEENGVDRIVTFCQSVDDMLDGGFPLQSLTELCGAPGSGKTQLCLQLCVAVQIPRTCGGLEGQALYIDTRNGFTAGRLRDMAASCVSHCHLQGVKEFTVDKVMAGVHYILVHDVIELMAALHLVHSFIIKNDKVVLTNQLSTRVCPGMESNLIPSQGESYGQSMNQRLIVGCYHSNRHAAVLFKSVNTPYTSAMFQITKNGIRDSS